MRGISQVDLTKEVLGRLQAAGQVVHTALAPLDDDQLNWKPPGGGWSVAECLDHLVVTHDAYWPRLQKVTGSTAPRAPSENRVVSTWLGKALFSAVDPESTKRLKAPKIFAPGRSQVPGTPIEAFHRCHQILGRFVEATADLDWHRIRITSPASRLLRFRLGDAYRVLAAHMQRHVDQAERVTQTDGFPRGAAH